MQLFLALLTAFGVLVALSGIRLPSAWLRGPVEERLFFYGVPDANDESALLRLTFYERVLAPLQHRLAVRLGRLTPQVYRDRLRAAVEFIDDARIREVDDLVLISASLLVVGALTALALGALVNSANVTLMTAPLLALVLAALPFYWLSGAVARRRRAILGALPDVIDFLVVTGDAGLTFHDSLQRVVTRFHNPLTERLARALREAELGRDRWEALEDFGRRTGVTEVTVFIQTVMTSERLGVPVSRTMRVQAEDIRRRQRERVEQAASRAPVFMTLAMAALIFPTLWMILLGPAIVALLVGGF